MRGKVTTERGPLSGEFGRWEDSNSQPLICITVMTMTTTVVLMIVDDHVDRLVKLNTKVVI